MRPRLSFRGVVGIYNREVSLKCLKFFSITGDMVTPPVPHYSVPRQERFTADLPLLPNRLPDSEARIEEFYGPSGTGDPAFPSWRWEWEDRPAPPNGTTLGHVFTADHNAFNCCGLTVLKVNRESKAKNGFSPDIRLLSPPGITNSWEGVE